MSPPAPTKDWYSPGELAVHCGCSVDEIEALTRRHHWPRVHGEHGGKIGVDVATVQRALGSAPTTVHGSVESQPARSALGERSARNGGQP